MNHASKPLEDVYRIRFPSYEALTSEVVYSIKKRLDEAGLKIHSVTSRVKTLDGFLEKVERKQYANPFDDMPDLAGVRVVCLFMSDLEAVTSLLEQEFKILNKEDKVKDSKVDEFGYMSVHYECCLGDRYAGPRYDHLTDFKFELQVRTMVMDAWANVSHFLAYKGEASIPVELRKDFHALSGLFYVADRHFQLFYESKQIAQESAVKEVAGKSSASVPINLETLSAFLDKRYPERKTASADTVSELVEELAGVGYTTIGDLDNPLDSANALALEYEQEYMKKAYLGTVGMVRLCLLIADARYRKSEGLSRRLKEQFDPYVERFSKL